jgi:hypothetical protein
MVRILIIAAVLALAGFLIWNCAAGNEPLALGFSADKPLGDAEKVEAHLVAKGLMKGDIDKEGVRLFFGDRYGDDVVATAYDDRVAGSRHFIIVVKSRDGKMLGLSSQFRSGAKDFSMVGTACERFAAQYWMHIAGKRPDYKKLMEGGADARDYWLATVSKGGATCTWRKDGAGGPGSPISQEVHDKVVFTAP